MDEQDRWAQTWTHLGISPPTGLLERLVAAYTEPHRAYHTVQHLRECFEQLDSCLVSPESPASLELALWFHDAIYDTKSSDNEADSAAWFLEVLGDHDESFLDTTESLILVTKHSAAPETPDEQLLLDIDLSILGAPTERFDQYEVQVRREFQWVPEEAYRGARLKILREFYDRPTLYHTEHFQRRLAAQARENLARSISSLAV